MRVSVAASGAPAGLEPDFALGFGLDDLGMGTLFGWPLP
jgi:hypothetical protein